LEQLIKAIILGIVQGLTEWLPISSTGHLKLIENFLGFEAARELVLFDVILHVGTLIVILVFFRRDVGKTLSAVVRLDFETEYGRMVPLIVVGTVPTALIGIVFGELIKSTFREVLSIAVAFIFCGVILYSVRIGKERREEVGYLTAVMMGVAQGIAIIPGISRSGATIAVALLLGVKREKAFKFSFLLSVPAILGALGYTFYTEFGKLALTGLGLGEIIGSAVVAMFVGYFALKLLWKAIAQEKFHLFAFYCWLLGVTLILLSLGVF